MAIFGSSRIQPEDAAYAQVRELARQLSYMGCDIVTGGGPGLMRAANEGARAGAYHYKTRSFGLTILLPMEEQPNPFLDEVAQHSTFFSRLHQFIRLSHAYIVMDGGIGTTLEAMMVWQLLQVQMMRDRTLIFVGPMWPGLRSWIEREIIGRGLASPPDLDIAVWVDTVGRGPGGDAPAPRGLPAPAQGDPAAGDRGPDVEDNLAAAQPLLWRRRHGTLPARTRIQGESGIAHVHDGL